MGVYINMDMPKPGRYEAVIIVIDKSTAEIAISPAEDDIGYWKEYPLVPVPPHGRLIDADALYAVMKKERDRIAKDFGDDDPFVRCLTKYAMNMVLSAPTIIPADKEM